MSSARTCGKVGIMRDERRLVDVDLGRGEMNGDVISSYCLRTALWSVTSVVWCGVVWEMLTGTGFNS